MVVGKVSAVVVDQRLERDSVEAPVGHDDQAPPETGAYRRDQVVVK
jgi:hypothetical protein